MTRKAIYAPPPIFGLPFLKVEPTVVEFLNWEPNGMARIRVVVPKDALINILARIPEERRVDRVEERIVIGTDLTIVEAES